MGNYYSKLPSQLLKLPMGVYSFDEACFILDMLDRQVESEKDKTEKWSSDAPDWNP
jgi:hypothetical protein